MNSNDLEKSKLLSKFLKIIIKAVCSSYKPFTKDCVYSLLLFLSGADPGFCVREDKIRQGEVGGCGGGVWRICFSGRNFEAF